MPPASPSAQRLTLITLILASGMVFLDGSVVNVALPAIQRNLDAGLSELQWIVDGYILALSALLITAGSLGDIYGKRRVMLIGIVAFAITSLFCGLASTAGMLVGGRLLQGVAGALLVPGSLAIINSIYSDPEARGKAIGTWAGWSGITTVFGPFVGGWLVDTFSWHWVFLLNVPIAAATAVMMLRYVPETPPEPGRRVDVAGALLTIVGLGGLTFGLIEGPAYGWQSPLIAGALTAGVVAIVAFPFVESRIAQPMVPLKLFRFGNFSGANLATFCVYAALSATSFFAGLYIQNVMGYSATLAGAAFVPISLLLLLLSPRMGSFAGKYGPRWPMTIGPLVNAAGIWLLAQLQPDSSYLLHLLPAMLVMSLGLALTVAPLTTAVMSAVPAESSGIASAINNVVSRVAGLLAIAGLGVVSALAFQGTLAARLSGLPPTGEIATRLAEIAATPTGTRDLSGLPTEIARAVTLSYTDAYQQVMLVTAVLAAAGGVLSWLTIRNPGPARERQQPGSQPQ